MGAASSLGRVLKQNGGLKISLYAEATPQSFRSIPKFGCDAVIVRVTSEAIRRAAMKVRLPLVNASSWLEHPGVPTVRHDLARAGRLAAEYLLDKGVREFGSVVFPGGWYIQARQQAFEQVLQQHGITPKTIFLKSHYPQKLLPLPESERHRFRQWVSQLAPSAALVLTDDYDAGILMEVCREAGLEIPRDLSLLAIGSHGNWSPPCPVPLSTVEQDDDRQMAQILAALQRQAQGLPLRQSILEIPPKGVLERESTRDGHINDHAIRHVLSYIRTNPQKRIKVKHLIKVAKVSRVTLERRFKRATGQSPGEYLIQHRVHKAKTIMLQKPQERMGATARAAGFRNYHQFRLNFIGEMGTTPKQWLVQQAIHR
ncbi:MAG: substrate-binding domain-containing protein [Verrucomicrobiae bacterium]